MIPKSPCLTLTSYMSSSPAFPIAYRMLLPGIGYHLNSPCANGTQLFLPNFFSPPILLSYQMNHCYSNLTGKKF